MTPRLQKLLDKLRKPKGDTQTTTATEVQEIPVEESTALVLVPFFDCKQEDEFSKYF